MDAKKVFLIRPLFFSKARLLVMLPEAIKMGRSEDIPDITFEREEIEAYRYKAARVHMYGLPVYSYYKIDIRSLSGQTIKIRLLSILGVGKDKKGQTYTKALQTIYQYYFRNVVIEYLEFLKNGIDFEISGLIFTKDGIQLDKKADLIQWEDVGTRNYYFNYAVYSKNDQYNCKNFGYWEEWNTPVIYSLTRSILKAKKLLNEKD